MATPHACLGNRIQKKLRDEHSEEVGYTVGGGLTEESRLGEDGGGGSDDAAMSPCRLVTSILGFGETSQLNTQQLASIFKGSQSALDTSRMSKLNFQEASSCQ